MGIRAFVGERPDPDRQLNDIDPQAWLADARAIALELNALAPAKNRGLTGQRPHPRPSPDAYAKLRISVVT
jgi:hypothetical protein